VTVVIDNIAVALGVDVPDADSTQAKQWQMWISDAEMLITARLGDLAALDQDVLDYVVREAVVAQVRRPDDAHSVEVSVDDGRVAKHYSTSRGRVFIRDEWWAMLDPDKTKSGAFVLNMAPGGGIWHSPYCSLMPPFNALYCSCGADLTLAGPLYEVP
jgi:hypothetical protein